MATAEEAELHTAAAEARVSLFGVLAFAGDLAGAMREADLAERRLRGGALAVLVLQRANVLQIRGELDAALASYQRALPGLRRAGDRANLARLHTNRGLLLASRGDHSLARSDLVAAVRLHEQVGNHRLAAQTRQNVGLAAGQRGDVAEALRWFSAADEYFGPRGEVDAVGLLDRSYALLQGRLAGEARESAASAVRHLTAQRRATYVAEAELTLGEAALLDGDAREARAAAARAEAAFAAQDRPVWLARARYLAVRAGVGLASEADLAAEAAGVADALERAGWLGAAVDARVIAGRAAALSGRRDLAVDQLSRARGARRRGPAGQRARAWHAEALLRLDAGDRAGTLAALRAGMRVIEANRAALAATDLRAHASGHGDELARLGVRLAVEAGDTAGAFLWAERGRAGAMWARPARPPADAALAADLDALRQAVKEVDDAAIAGRDTRAAVARQARLEEAVRRRTRTAAGAAADGPGAPPAQPSLTALRRALRGAALIELVDVDGRLHAAVLSGRGMRWFDLGSTAPVAAEVAALRFARRRLALGRGPRASLDAALAATRHAATRLDELLVRPLDGALGDGELVVMPTGALHGVCFAMLPSLRGRAVSVAPSAALWWRAATAPAGDGTGAGPGPAVVAIAAPAVPGADAEALQVRRLHPDATVLRGARARCRAALRAMNGADLVHVASHGVFRADNPLFSHLQLADGPLMVYDIEALPSPPRALVLSACDAAVSEVRPGDELMGLAAGLLAAGVRTVVAALGAVPHETAQALMKELHTRLRAGAGPARALAEAQRDLAAAAPSVAGLLDFVCLGDGTRAVTRPR